MKRALRAKTIFIFLMVLSGHAAAGVLEDAPESADYSLVYELNIPDTAAYNYNGVSYNQDKSETIDFSFDRVAYHLELQEPGGERIFVYVSLPTPFLTADQTGIPHSGTGVAVY